jgi:hypothetical protein
MLGCWLVPLWPREGGDLLDQFGTLVAARTLLIKDVMVRAAWREGKDVGSKWAKSSAECTLWVTETYASDYEIDPIAVKPHWSRTIHDAAFWHGGLVLLLLCLPSSWPRLLSY